MKWEKENGGKWEEEEVGGRVSGLWVEENVGEKMGPDLGSTHGYHKKKIYISVCVHQSNDKSELFKYTKLYMRKYTKWFIK